MTDSKIQEKEKQAMISSLRMLAASPKSQRTLREKLAAKGYPEGVIEKTLLGLERQGLVNDRAFAQGVLESYSHDRASGRRRVAFEMKKRGISRQMTEEVLEQYRPEDEFEVAVELAGAKIERWNKLAPLKKRKKLYDFLCRRGFDFGLVRDVVERALQEKAG